MAGKKRSGLANDRRAYGCGRCYTPTPTPCIPVAIDIGSIATYDGESTYILNGNQTITACQILNIPVGTILGIIEGQTLTNSGTINNSGSIYNNSGTINNSGTTNNSGNLHNVGGTINNSGTIKNNGNIFNNIGGIGNNNAGGFIYTYGGGNIFNDIGATVNNNAGGTISTANGLSTCGTGTLSGSGTINNSGSINTNCPP